MIDKCIKLKCNAYDHSYIFDGILGKCVPFSNSNRGFDNFLEYDCQLREL